MVNPVVGTAVIAFGLVFALRPEGAARVEEQLDAIGTERSAADVEPADWKVQVNRVFGLAVSVFGVLVLFDI